ncbi:MAG: RNA 3'-terminal phosphate cyclase [Haloarculaceae archaeon]
MLEIDGAEGGGQILRTALALSMLDVEPVRIENVRGNRSSPGLKAQHLTAVETAAAICDADVEGTELESETIVFEPGDPSGGTYEAFIETAGSITLLFETLLPVATRLEEPLVVEAEGGTDVKWSPSLDYYRRVKLPLLRETGLAAAVEPHRRGFYPAGGGRATLRLWPSECSALELGDRGALGGMGIHSTASDGLAESEVAERQARAVREELDGADVDVPVVEREARYVDAPSPGSVVVASVEFEGGRAGFDALGERGKPAEDVAEEAAEQALSFIGGEAAVDAHLADQVLVFLALGGGRVRIPDVTNHVETNLAVLEQFDYGVDCEKLEHGGAVLSA